MTRLTLVAVLLYASLFVTAFEPYEAPRQDLTLIGDSRYVVPQRYTRIFWRYVAETGVPADIACRLIQEESGWNRFARHVNSDGSVDKGLMQLNSKYIKSDYRWRFNDGRKIDPFDAETSMRVGLRKLALNHTRLGSWWSAVAAYNCGLDWFRNHRPYDESIALANKVLEVE